MRNWVRFASTKGLHEVRKLNGYGQSQYGYAATIKSEVERELKRRARNRKKDHGAPR